MKVLKREVKIQIKGIQRNEEAEESIETAAFGEFDQTGENYYLKYEELSEDGEITKTLIKIYDKNIEVIKRGSIESKMVFIPNTVTETDYSTCYGVLAMSVSTLHTAFRMEENSVTAEIEYILYLNGTMVSVNFLNIEAVFLENCNCFP